MADSVMATLVIRNTEKVSLDLIPIMGYGDFQRKASSLMQKDSIHCTAYFAFPRKGELNFICALADDKEGVIHLFSHKREADDLSPLESLTADFPSMHFFERVIHERFGIGFEGHPWLKPVRYPCDRYDPSSRISDYPFYKVSSEELHEVGVGPIHAGVIEPGHFRFTCNGEMVLHLEIQLGWQHRGMEKALLDKKSLLGRTLLSEQIAGDTAIGHSLAFAHAVESLGGVQVSSRLAKERTVALELERMAVHTGDMSALCTDVAYQLGNAVLGVLRTPLVNFMQEWCGNRLGKSMIRPGGTWRPLTGELMEKLLKILEDYEVRFLEVARDTRYMSGIENRFENIGGVTGGQAKKIGAVGMAARMSGVPRDIRSSHPTGGYRDYSYEPVLLEKGDVLSRFILRKLEIARSLELIRRIVGDLMKEEHTGKEIPPMEINRAPESLALSLVEGWRGEICHTLITDSAGDLVCYNINDPSVHNWKALELSLRNLEISDFPINNKSYNLSYCGHDL